VKQLARLAVLASGEGSNLQAILDACGTGRLQATVSGVVSDVADANALLRAKTANVESVVFVPARAAAQTRAGWDAALAEIVGASSPDVVVLAGFMRLLSNGFLAAFPSRVVNLHPALPGELPGLHAIERAFAEFRAGERSHSGVMVHLVPDEGVDSGPVLGTEVVSFHADDTLDVFAERVHAAEHRLLIATLQQLIVTNDEPGTRRSDYATHTY
jgi:phosphoribosylglycinamide formyltransferase 1